MRRLIALGGLVARAGGEVVGPDQGATHVLAASGAPTRALFGSQDPTRTAPMTARALVSATARDCVPCRARRCSHPEGPICMAFATEAGVEVPGWRPTRSRHDARPMLETFANPKPDRDYEIHFVCPEFTCVCPRTGQPDFATIEVRYTPADLCVELKSFKLYLWSFREEGAFHEAVTNRILDDLVGAVAPRRMQVIGRFNVRGGIATTVTADHRRWS